MLPPLSPSLVLYISLTRSFSKSINQFRIIIKRISRNKLNNRGDICPRILLEIEQGTEKTPEETVLKNVVIAFVCCG